MVAGLEVCEGVLSLGSEMLSSDLSLLLPMAPILGMFKSCCHRISSEEAVLVQSCAETYTGSLVFSTPDVFNSALTMPDCCDRRCVDEALPLHCSYLLVWHVTRLGVKWLVPDVWELGERCSWPCAAGFLCCGKYGSHTRSATSAWASCVTPYLVEGSELEHMDHKDWIMSGTTLWFDVPSSLSSNQFGIGLVAIGSTVFLLLQIGYLVAMIEKQGTNLDLFSLKLWLEKMNCKIITQPSASPISCGVLPVAQVKYTSMEIDKFNLAYPGLLLVHFALYAINLKMIASPNEQDYATNYCCTMLSLTDGAHVEEIVLLLFGFFHQMWMTTRLLLIPRFNSKDLLWLSSVMVHGYLQLNSIQSQVHTPDRPSGEPPAGHQLVWSTETFGDCGCGIFESELSTDDRWLIGSIGNPRFLHVFSQCRPSVTYVVQLGTSGSCSVLESHVMMYCDPYC